MKLIITKNYEELSKEAANEMAKVVKDKPNASNWWISNRNV